MKKSLGLLAIVLLLGTICFSFVGCSGRSSIVGNWALKGESEATVHFYENGDLDVPYSMSGSQMAAEKYEVMSDGTMFLKSAIGDTLRTLTKVNTKNCEGDEYYLSGNTLILDGDEYQRVK